MEIQSSRFKTRVSLSGEPILLMDQNRSQWDRLLIRRGLAALERSQKLGRPLGPYSLQAAILRAMHRHLLQLIPIGSALLPFTKRSLDKRHHRSSN